MTKNRSMRIAVLVLALALITCCFVGTTFAKYTSKATGSSVGTVAKWAVSVNGTNIAVTPDATLTFNLFDTVNEADTTTAEEDVADDVIAPGTGGSVSFSLVNNSEVNATYTITFAETANASSIPIEYATNIAEGTANWTDDPTTLTLTPAVGDKLEMNETQTSGTIYWRWAFGDGSTDTADTALGIGAQTAPATVTLTATVTVDQVD